VVEPFAEARERLARDFGIVAQAEAGAALARCELVVWAVKPQSFAEAARPVRGLAPDALHLSVAAGIPSASIARWLGTERVVRAMPNTPALVGAGATALCAGPRASASDVEFARSLFDACGRSVVVDETHMDAVTGLSGSGPAYVYRFAEAMLAGGIAAGLPGPMARQLTIQTLVGAAAMLKESGEPPETLRARVSSPGGTTLAGLSELEHRGFKEAIAAAIIAATRRSQELGRASR